MRDRRVLVALLAILVAPGLAAAAEQLVSTKVFLVKNPPSGARKVLWKVIEKASAAMLIGDPSIDGATLHVVLTPGGDQCVTMPASGWSAVGAIGFKYKDPTLANGPVKVALVKKAPSGTFLVKALLKDDGPTPIAITPGAPTASYATNFTLGTGDEYCGGTATATPNPNDAVTFKVSNDGTPGGCVASCNATTPTSTTTTSTVAGACTRTQDCPANHVCAAGECVDVTSGSIIASLIESSYLTDQCLAPVAIGSTVLGADACHLSINGCTPGCHVDVAPDAVSVTASAPGTWSTAPMLDVDVQFDASTGGPVHYTIIFIPGSCTFDLTRTNLTASIGVTFAPDGTPTATTDAATLGSPMRAGCLIGEAVVTDAIDAVDAEFTAALAGQMEAVRLALEGYLQP